MAAQDIKPTSEGIVVTGGFSCFAITKSDSTTYTNLRGIYVGVTGNVAVTDGQGNVVTWTAVPAGMIIPIAATKVMSTNTTASSMVGIY